MNVTVDDRRDNASKLFARPTGRRAPLPPCAIAAPRPDGGSRARRRTRRARQMALSGAPHCGEEARARTRRPGTGASDRAESNRRCYAHDSAATAASDIDVPSTPRAASKASLGATCRTHESRYNDPTTEQRVQDHNSETFVWKRQHTRCREHHGLNKSSPSGKDLGASSTTRATAEARVYDRAEARRIFEESPSACSRSRVNLEEAFGHCA